MTATETLITKVANAAQGHDSLGPTGLVVHLTPAERDKIVASLARTTPSDAQVEAAAKAIRETIGGSLHQARAALTAAAQAGEEHEMNRAVGVAIQAAFPGPAPAPLGWVLVPKARDDNMREAMRVVEDGSSRTYDEVIEPRVAALTKALTEAEKLIAPFAWHVVMIGKDVPDHPPTLISIKVWAKDLRAASAWVECRKSSRMESDT